MSEYRYPDQLENETHDQYEARHQANVQKRITDLRTELAELNDAEPALAQSAHEHDQRYLALRCRRSDINEWLSRLGA